MKSAAPLKTDIELAVAEGERRHIERVIQAYTEIGSVLRTAQLMRMSEEDVQAIVDSQA